MKILIVLLHVVLSFTFLPLSQCKIHPLDDNLIQETCKQTPLYDLCVSSLESDPRSSTAADVRHLALIMVDIIKAKSSDIFKRIEELQQQHKELQQPLSDCHSRYNAIIVGDVPQASEALQTGNFKFAEDGANDAAIEADVCESNFSGKSPMTEMNKLMHDISVVTASIVRILLIG